MENLGNIKIGVYKYAYFLLKKQTPNKSLLMEFVLKVIIRLVNDRCVCLKSSLLGQESKQ